ncbi:FAD-dependent thymidylate synthase [Pseudodesulfovibrio senegalensis]|jgi:thymidylate synthase (FAD)|uniref:Flavin-dependent thymidylate synthase n=1 Tax=Pseudodesulfovibrio senegalensis TaxID=1721087 RepID=A0A6N6N485_9BACT|nr:FAD-dependent thymidylate synthase [Pseudodesulfovibrio senegalensis]KAB1442387.1 FAD-dependent thymidylate synthase [Pseudodesulfovibrio senegalensis]
MPEKELRVDLLSVTPHALSLIYAAFRQCYHAGFVADMWPRLLNGEIEREVQADFVRKVLDSGHDSPVEHVSFTYAIEGISRACSHQLVRHRIASYSQQSQRYVTDSMEYVLPPAIARIPEAKKRFERFMEEVGAAYGDLHDILVANGRKSKANEDARFVLPQAAETKIVVTMNCRSLLHFFSLRCCMRAQWEVRAMAQQMLELAKKELPAIFETAGARCEQLGYCPESPKFACGKYPTREQGA